MKSTMASASSSKLSPHAAPFTPSCADVDRFVPSSPVISGYSCSPYQPQVLNASSEDYYGVQYNGLIPYHSPDDRAPTPVSTIPSQSYPSPNGKTLFPCLTLKKLEIARDPNSELSPEDASLIDSPCYKGRNWSQTTPFHMGETSAPPRVTVKKLGEEDNLSVEVTPVAHIMVSNDKENRPFVAVPMGPLDSGPVDSSRGNLIKQKLDPGMLHSAAQKIVGRWKVLAFYIFATFSIIFVEVTGEGPLLLN